MRIRRLCAGRALLKVILETGEIGDAAKIRAAADLALARYDDPAYRALLAGGELASGQL